MTILPATDPGQIAAQLHQVDARIAALQYAPDALAAGAELPQLREARRLLAERHQIAQQAAQQAQQAADAHRQQARQQRIAQLHQQIEGHRDFYFRDLEAARLVVEEKYSNLLNPLRAEIAQLEADAESERVAAWRASQRQPQ